MKKVLSMVLAMAMMLSMVGVSFAAPAGVMSATVDGPAQRGGEVEVSINFDTNPGFWMGTAEVCFPEELTYVGTTNTNLFGSSMSFSATPDEGVVQLTWYPSGMDTYTNTGTAAVMTFKVSAAAVSLESYPITIENINMASIGADYKEVQVPFNSVGCNVVVEGSAGYLVRSTAGENGTISPLGDTEVAKGGNVVYTITADEGYHVADIQMNNVSVMFDPASEVVYNMKNITDVRTIHATFEPHAPVGDNGNCEDVITCEVCGEVLKEATEHTWDEGTETLAPTCTENGTMHYVCTVDGCSGEKDEDIEATGHDYEAVVTDPTCTEQGYTTYTCVEGDDTYVADYVPATGHDYETVVTAPTCTTQGYTTYTCVEGDHQYIADYVDATGHTWDLGTVTLAPTCTEQGIMTYTCVNGCGATDEREIAATGHDYEAVVTAPTCTEQGYTTYTCVEGDDTYVADYVDATGHSWDNGTVKVAATCTTEGVMLHTCVNGCGATEERPIEMLPHDCTETILKEATCTENGLKAMACKNCTYTEDEAVIEATGHDYETVVTVPTCTTQGYTTYTCVKGDHQYIDDYVPATGHSWDEGTVTLAPTCTETGVMTHTCLNGCGETKTEDIAATGHNHEAVVTAPTCTEQGYTTYTCACGDSYVADYVPATGHSWDEGTVTKAPTCTETGVMTHTCLNGCGETKTEDITATGHDHEAVVTAPTCTEQGYTTYTCACGDSYVADYVPATGHSWDEGTVTLAPTCTETGVMTHTCVNGCGETKTEEIAATGHDVAETVTKVPTCTEAGEKVMKCQHCDYTEGEPTTIPATGHNYEDGTCTGCGQDKPTSGGSSGGGGGGGGSSSAVSEYTLTFDTNGGSAITKVTVDRGTEIDLSKYVPTRSGYDFEGWYSNESLTKKVTTITLNRNTTVYAKWTEKAVVDLPFADVNSHWGKEAIEYAYSNGFMMGVSSTQFGPDVALSRGMLVTILYRLEGSPIVTEANPFSDVSAGSYYANAITWAASKGVVAGVGEGKFAPDAPLTREQLATIMFRYSALKGNANTESGSLAGFHDADKVSSWALDYVKWAVGAGMISGTDTGALDPQGVTTRAQCAQILYRFLEK